MSDDNDTKKPNADVLSTAIEVGLGQKADRAKEIQRALQEKLNEGVKFSETYESGKDPFEVELHSGDTYWADVEGDKMILDGVSYSATHDVKNIDVARYREFVIEIK
ncbi:MAG TPA: hypothetical protein EYQ81_08000 [Sneathiellales bacterium]|nr:hypothetical protein [Sneathiellales bacterium]